MFESILVANRGEIAVRVLTAAKTLGIRAVAVFSEADREALHVRVADEAHRIGAAAARDSYLDVDAVLAAALAAGASAVHPGYGFLSENAGFARAVEDAGLVFIGPPPDVIARMGDKLNARAAAREAGLPVLPGSAGPIGDAAEAGAIADEVGYPVVVKARYGGGGRGMRVAEARADLDAAIEAAGREANAAFGRPELFIEHFLVRPRHVEVQIVADNNGAVLHLGDRDCTVQRRQQKLVEEAPAPGIDPSVRSALHAAAVTLCRRVGYRGAGTVEFLLDPQTSRYFFLEMNTRLQVEHGVTELVTGTDLVETQIAIAAGMPIPFAQTDVELRGHAIQARLVAEDPCNAFLPTSGLIEELRVPLGPWLRADLGVEAGDRVEPFYDSLFGKLMAWGPDRESARRRLRRALRDFRIGGVSSTASYLAGVLDEEDFRDVRHSTGSVEQDWSPLPDDRPAKSPAPPAFDAGRRIRLPGVRPIELVIHGARSATSQPPAGGQRNATPPRERPEPGFAAPAAAVVSPIDGVVVAIQVAKGATVARGDVVAVLEAMKMEIAVTATSGGVVTAIGAAPGTAIKRGSLLVEVEP